MKNQDHLFKQGDAAGVFTDPCKDAKTAVLSLARRGVDHKDVAKLTGLTLGRVREILRLERKP